MEVVDAVEARRARRILSERRIESDKVEALIQSVRLSASCFNNQPWRLVFCSAPESLDAVRAALSRGNAWATKAPLIIVVCARAPDDCQLSDGRDYFLFDCGLAVGQMEMQATSLGLVAHPIAGYDPEKVRKALGIPDDHIVITLVICGYPGTDDTLLSEKQKEAERERPERKPSGENIFSDHWGQPHA